MNTQGLISGMRTGLGLLSAKERRRAGWVFLSILGNAVLQTAALAGVVPFVQLLVDPQQTQDSKWARLLTEAIATNSSDTLLVVVGLCLLATVGIKNLYAWHQLRWQNEFAARCENRLGSTLFRQVLDAPYAWSLGQNSVVIREIILGHVVQWSRGFLRASLQFANDAIFAAFVLGVLLWSSPKAGIIVCTLAILLGWVLFRITRPIVLEKTERKQVAIRAASLACIQGVSGIKDVKMTGSQRYFSDVFRDHFLDYSVSDAATLRWKNLPRLGIEFIGYGALVVVSLIAVSTGETGGSTASLLALYAMATVRMMPVLSTIVTTLGGLLDAMPLIRELTQLLADTARPEAQSSIPTAPTLKDWRQIRFAGVSYCYPGSENNALEAIDLTLERGKSYGLVGASGAGKSTFVDLLAGLLEPTEGSISAGTEQICAENLLAWRSRIGYVSQNPFILDNSLLENITFGQAASEVDKVRLDNAVRGAQLGKVIGALPDGLDTRLGERGVRLSGGQRQRVAIARALYRDVDMLILDEATSALDNLTEREIAQEIEALAATITIVLIAHRLDTVRNCDKILLFEDGRIVASGRHQELMRDSPLFKSLVKAHDESVLHPA